MCSELRKSVSLRRPAGVPIPMKIGAGIISLLKPSLRTDSNVSLWKRFRNLKFGSWDSVQDCLFSNRVHEFRQIRIYSIKSSSYFLDFPTIVSFQTLLQFLSYSSIRRPAGITGFSFKAQSLDFKRKFQPPSRSG